MPALVVTGFVLCFIMCGMEIYTVRKYQAIGRFLESRPGITLIFSLGISLLMGMIFPIVGISAMIGAFGSTLLMQVYYWGVRTWHKMIFWRSTQPT